MTASTGPNRHDQLRRRDRIMSVLQRCRHVSSYRPGDQQHIRMFRRCDEVNSKSLQVVVGVGKGDDLCLAAFPGEAKQGQKAAKNEDTDFGLFETQ
jgi:hypothetical protein